MNSPKVNNTENFSINYALNNVIQKSDHQISNIMNDNNYLKSNIEYTNQETVKFDNIKESYVK